MNNGIPLCAFSYLLEKKTTKKNKLNKTCKQFILRSAAWLWVLRLHLPWWPPSNKHTAVQKQQPSSNVFKVTLSSESLFLLHLTTDLKRSTAVGLTGVSNLGHECPCVARSCIITDPLERNTNVSSFPPFDNDETVVALQKVPQNGWKWDDLSNSFKLSLFC